MTFPFPISIFAIVAICNLVVGVTESPANWVQIINTAGVAGVLVWFLYKLEPRLRAIESSNDRQTRAIIVLTIAFEGASKASKIQAKAIEVELDEAKKARKEP